MPRFTSWGAPLLVSALAFAAGCAGVRASHVPLGGERELQAEPARPRSGSLPAAPEATASAAGEDEAGAQQAVSSTASAPAPSSEPLKPAAPAAFQLRPYAVGQRWTRSFELEMNVKVGPDFSVDMRMQSRQEARFEVLAVSGSTLDKLQIEYPVYSTSLSVMGGGQRETTEEVAGKTYVITFGAGKPVVRDGSGATPSKKELDSVNDDAREPIEMAKALAELAQLTAKGSGDFSAAGALALAGGEDDDTKVSRAKGSLRSLGSGKSGAKTALIDLAYTLTSILDDGDLLEAQLSGSLTVLDAPARYDTVTLQGPVELKSQDPDGMQGRGSVKVTTSYKH